MNIKWKCVLVSTAFLSSSVGYAKTHNLDNKINNYLPYLEFSSTGFFNIDVSKGALGADLFVPVWQQPQQIVFTHLRLFDRADAPFEGNLHVGYRYLAAEKEQIYGVYGAFDRRRTIFGNFFNQITVGAECWLNKIFIGGNYYQPLTGAKSVSVDEQAQYNRIQNNIGVRTSTQEEKAMPGVDAEVGYEFIRGLIGYVGGYTFATKNMDGLYGPRAHVTYDWFLDNGKRIFGVFDKVGLDCGVQRDKPRGTTYYVNANIRIGLLPNRENKLYGVARHMVDLVRRDVDIITGTSITTTEDVHKKSDGAPLVITEVDADNVSESMLSTTLATSDVVSVKGHLDNVSPSLVNGITSNKTLVFGDTLQIVSPTTQKVLAVDISHPSKKQGTISHRALNTLMQINSAESDTTVLTAVDIQPEKTITVPVADTQGQRRQMSALSQQDHWKGVSIHMKKVSGKTSNKVNKDDKTPGYYYDSVVGGVSAMSEGANTAFGRMNTQSLKYKEDTATPATQTTSDDNKTSYYASVVNGIRAMSEGTNTAFRRMNKQSLNVAQDEQPSGESTKSAVTSNASTNNTSTDGSDTNSTGFVSKVWSSITNVAGLAMPPDHHLGVHLGKSSTQ